MVEPCPLIEISGPPETRGRQYGQQAAARIRKGIAHYGGQLRRLDMSPGSVAELVQSCLKPIEDFDDSYIPEMRGIAAGAGVEFEDVVLLNARTEILKLAQRPDLRAHLAGALDEGGCTAVCVLPEATADRRVIHAQNWDWKAECAETAVVLRIRRDDGPDMLTFTEAGGLARSGMNAAGVAITANYLQCDRDYRQLGVPLALIRRKVLQQEHLALAMRAVYATPKSAANNMMVSHSGGVVIDFECAPDESFQVHATEGLLVHANHFVSPVALAKLRDAGVANSPCTIYRDLRVRSLIAPHAGAVMPGHVKAALFDTFGAPWSVCRPIRPSLDGTLSATVAMIVMVPELGLMEVAMLPAQNDTFTRFAISDQVNARAAE